MAVSDQNSEEPFSYDLAAVREVDTFGRIELYVRIGLAAVIAMVLWLGFDLWLVLILWAVHSIGLILQVWVTNLMPARVGLAGVAAISGMTILNGLLYVATLCYLWVQGDTMVRLIGVVGLAALMVDTLSSRRYDAVIVWSDVVSIASAIVAIPALSLILLDRPEEALTIVITLLVLSTMFLVGLFDVMRARSSLARADAMETERARIAALGQLTGGVAHDFNNLLTVISGNLELMAEIDDPVEKAHLATEAHNASLRAAQVASQLLAFSRQSILAPAPTDIVASVSNVSDLLMRLLPETITLQVRFGTDMPTPVLDRSKFETVLLNLCLNARDAMPDGGYIEIRACVVGLNRGHFVNSEGPIPKGRYLQVIVSDTGVGIPPKDLARVCEPYFTTKGLGKGSGLGLAMARGFAEQSDGALSIHSEVGAGTQVHIAFPIPIG